MVKNPSIASLGSDATRTNLERMLQRLKILLVTPDANTEELLRTSNEERLKVAAVSLPPRLLAGIEGVNTNWKLKEHQVFSGTPP